MPRVLLPLYCQFGLLYYVRLVHGKETLFLQFFEVENKKKKKVHIETQCTHTVHTHKHIQHSLCRVREGASVLA